MIERILIPTDGSEAAFEAAAHGIELAEKFGANVDVFHAVEPIPLGKVPAGMEAAATEFDEVVERQEAAGHRAVNEVLDLADGSGLEVQAHVTFGAPATEIVEHAETHGVDLIVMGTQGRNSAEDFFLGSVAERVVRRSTVPVLTYRSNA